MAKWSSSNVTLMIIYINVALYATCFQMQRPLEPFLVDKLIAKGDSSDEYAKLQSFFSIMQTVGSFVSGRFLDNFGAKTGFIISFLASAMCYAILSQSTTIELLYLSKVPTIFQAGFLCAQVAASQATMDGAERVQALGRLTMSYTVGSVLGPTIGGLLGASGDYYLGAKLAVAGSLLSVVLTLFMSDDVSPTAKVANKTDGKEASTTKEVIPTTFEVINVVWLFLATKVITSVANAMAAAVLPIILKNTYGLDEKSLGFSMSLMSAFNALVNGLFLAPIVGLAGGDLKTVISVCISSMCVASAAQAFAALPSVIAASPIVGGGFYEYLSLTFVLSMMQYVLATTITGESTARVGPLAKGTLLGLEHSLFAAARVVAPQSGVYLLKTGGVSAVSAACAAVFAAVFGLWQACKDRKVETLSKATANDERKEK
jgi:OCT family organic cation transporter-like MFS transporter 18